MDQAFLNARAQASHWRDDPLESEMPKSGGSSPPISVWHLLSIPQPTNLRISDSRLRPKEPMGRTKTQTLLANPLPSLVPTSRSLVSYPCQCLVAQSSNPSQLAPRQAKSSPTFVSDSAFGPICQTLSFALAQSVLTH